MAVVFDAQGTAFIDGSTSPLDFTNLTVGSGANRGMVVQVVFAPQTLTVTVKWDPATTNQSVNVIGTAANSTINTRASLFGLVAPTSGNKTLRVSWTPAGGAIGVVVDAVAYSGVDQTGGATSFAHFLSATGTSATASVTITSAVGNAVVACGGNDDQGGTNTGNNTVVFSDNSLAGAGANSGWGNRAAGAATVAMNTTGLSAANAWVQIGCDIVAAAVAAVPWGWEQVGSLVVPPPFRAIGGSPT